MIAVACSLALAFASVQQAVALEAGAGATHSYAAGAANFALPWGPTVNLLPAPEIRAWGEALHDLGLGEAFHPRSYPLIVHELGMSLEDFRKLDLPAAQKKRLVLQAQENLQEKAGPILKNETDAVLSRFLGVSPQDAGQLDATLQNLERFYHAYGPFMFPEDSSRIGRAYKDLDHAVKAGQSRNIEQALVRHAVALGKSAAAEGVPIGGPSDTTGLMKRAASMLGRFQRRPRAQDAEPPAARLRIGRLYERIRPNFGRAKKSAYEEELRRNESKMLATAGLSNEAALQELASRETGLTAAEVEERRQVSGLNLLGETKKKSLPAEFLSRFKNPLVLQLLTIATVSLVMGDVGSAALVSAMILLSVTIATIQERQSHIAAEKLMAMVKTTTAVIRNGREEEVPLGDLVPGDVVSLAAGDIIPADIRLVSAKDLFVNQSTLTGESEPVEKSAASSPNEKAGALGAANLCFQGSTVISGTARGVVVLTGARTYLGAISQRLSQASPPTSFDQGLKRFTWLMMRFMAIMVGVVFLIVGLAKGSWVEALLFGLAVSIGLTPEMLPMMTTVNLSKGAIAMSKKKVIVKRLSSLQNFGAMDILATDKTGTLTQDNIILDRYEDANGDESREVLLYTYLNSLYQTGVRNRLDKAILARKDPGIEDDASHSRKVDEIPFDSRRHRLSVAVDYGDERVLISKGAVEGIFGVCGKYQTGGEPRPLTDEIKQGLMKRYEELSSDGFRVLAVAYRKYPRSKEVFSVQDESDMVFLGYIAFLDPPKETAAAALEALRKAGVTTKILTGDNALVTRKIAHEVGLPVDAIVTGDQLRDLGPEELAQVAEKGTIFARLSPDQKDRIIRALRSKGHVVGFLGDGINDAAALKTADVGISVDSAVDIAKESADIILLQKSLLVLGEGIAEGRKVFGNISKYIKMGASSNYGNMFSMVGGSYILPFLPMTPIQILFNNLLYDFSQVGIPLDRVDDDYITKPRKWDIESIKKFMLWIGPISSIFDYTTFALMWFVFGANGAAHQALFHTGWFVESLMTQTLIVHIIRTNRIPFIQSRASLPLILTTLLVMGAACLLPFSPLAGFLGLVPLPASFWPWLVATLLAYGVLTHVVKTWFIKKYGTSA